MKQKVFIVGLLSLVGSVQASEPLTELSQEAKSIIQPFAANLQSTLKQAMQASGPEGAILACNTEAPVLAQQASKNGWSVGRTSLKVRNPDNQPDAWKLATLQEFEQRKNSGEEPMSIAKAEIIEGEFRFMKAIPTLPTCVACHGSTLSDGVISRLSQLYPDDQATGFSVGDLRGAFTLSKRLD